MALAMGVGLVAGGLQIWHYLRPHAPAKILVPGAGAECGGRHLTISGIVPRRRWRAQYWVAIQPSDCRGSGTWWPQRRSLDLGRRGTWVLKGATLGRDGAVDVGVTFTLGLFEVLPGARQKFQEAASEGERLTLSDVAEQCNLLHAIEVRRVREPSVQVVTSTQSMKVGIVGSWRERDREVWSLRGDGDAFIGACRELGAGLALGRFQIVVGSDRPSTADCHVVSGYMNAVRAEGKAYEGFIRIMSPPNERVPFAAEYGQAPHLFTYMPTGHVGWQHLRYRFVREIDATIAIGGGDGTYQVGLEVMLAKKRLVPIASFGGASSRLFMDVLDSVSAPQRDHLAFLNNPWTSGSVSRVLATLGASTPSRIS